MRNPTGPPSSPVQKPSNICLRYFRPLQKSSSFLPTPCKTPPIYVYDILWPLQKPSRYLLFLCKSPAIYVKILWPLLQKPSNICLKFFRTHAKTHQPSYSPFHENLSNIYLKYFLTHAKANRPSSTPPWSSFIPFTPCKSYRIYVSDYL